MEVAQTRRQKRQQQRRQFHDKEGAKRLQEWKDEADWRARYLTAAEVWLLLDENAAEATRLRIFDELRDICFVAAAQFADRRMAKIVRCHRKGREVPTDEQPSSQRREATVTKSKLDNGG